ncbi:hypothetical protein FKM82_009250 [Ascaphus truei]
MKSRTFGSPQETQTFGKHHAGPEMMMFLLHFDPEKKLNVEHLGCATQPNILLNCTEQWWCGPAVFRYTPILQFCSTNMEVFLVQPFKDR